MNSWANIGDMVFVLSRDNEPIPCKVTKEIGNQLFFEPIIDEDKIKIPKTRLKAFMNQVGFNGGYVFKEKQNALDYLEEIETKGSFQMSSVISKKTKRAQKRISEQAGRQVLDIQKIKEDVAQETINRVSKVMIAAMLIALNEKLGIGPKRGAELVEEINNLINDKTPEELTNMAENKMKIKL